MFGIPQQLRTGGFQGRVCQICALQLVSVLCGCMIACFPGLGSSLFFVLFVSVFEVSEFPELTCSFYKAVLIYWRSLINPQLVAHQCQQT